MILLERFIFLKIYFLLNKKICCRPKSAGIKGGSLRKVEELFSVGAGKARSFFLINIYKIFLNRFFNVRRSCNRNANLIEFVKKRSRNVQGQ